MTLSFWQEAHRDRTVSYDALVVGGGLVGCSAAYWLAQSRPSWRIGIVEARTIGYGASSRNAGFVLQGTDCDYLKDVKRYGARTARRLWHFTRASRDLMFDELSPQAFGGDSQGSLTVAGTAEEDERLRASVPRMRSAGAPVVYLSAGETNERLHSTGFYGSLYVTSGAVVDPLRLVQHIAEASGADVLPHHPVQNVRSERGQTVLVTPERSFEAPRVVFAMGPSLTALFPSLGRYVRPVRAQMLATEPASDAVLQVPAYSHAGAYYLRQLPNGVVLVGGGRHEHRDAEETGVDTTTPAVQASIERYLHTFFPWTQGLSVRQRWSGTMGFSPDGRPVVGTPPGLSQALFAAGFTGHGISYGFRMGRLLADALCRRGRPDAYDLFSTERFERNPSRTFSPSTQA